MSPKIKNLFRIAPFLLPLIVLLYSFFNTFLWYYLVYYPRIKLIEASGTNYVEIVFLHNRFSTGMWLGLATYLASLIILVVLLLLKKSYLTIYLYLLTLSLGIISLNIVSSSLGELIPLVKEVSLILKLSGN